MQYLHKSKLKSEIFNERKSLLIKIFSSVSSDSEFSYFLKDGMGIKDKKTCILWGFTENLIFRVGSQK